MKRRILVSILMIIVVGIFLSVAYTNYTTSSNLYDLVFGIPELSKSEQEYLNNREYLIYSSDYDSPPLRYIDENTGAYKGIVVDYMSALSDELGIEIKLEPKVWQDALDALERGDVDMVDMYTSEKRGEIYNFTIPVFYQNAIMVVPKGSSIHSVNDLAGKNVAAQRGDFVNDYIVENAPDANIVNTNDYRQFLQLLKDGKVDAAVGDESVVFNFLNELSMTDDFVILDELLYENKFVLGVPKEQADLVPILNKAIKQLNKKEILVRIQQKWFGISTPINRVDSSDRVVMVMIFLFLVAFIGYYLFYAWNHELKSEVDHQTLALKTSEQALQTTFDSLNHLMIVVDHAQKIVNANSAFFSKINMTKDECVGQSINEVMGVKLYFQPNKTVEIDYKGRYYEMSTHGIDYEQSFIVMLKDITAKKINEKQLLSANKMAAIGQLAAGVAHEIRNPLGLIRNYTFLLKGQENLAPEVKEKSFVMIEKSVDRASKIIDNLLNFSSISGDQSVEFKVNDFLNNTVQLFEKTLANQNITAEIICDPSLVINTNLESMKHIYINLLSNAIDAIGNDGSILIRSWGVNDRIVFTIRDTGCGMSKEVLDNVFNPFFTTKATGEGTGLGLYIVYNEVEKLGGSIQVQSTEGNGTRIVIFFPTEGRT